MSSAERLTRRDLFRRPFSVVEAASATVPVRAEVAVHEAKATTEPANTALILAWGCLAHRGTTCTICVEHCGVEGAIRMEHGRPVVDPLVCTGCGDCADVCPSPRRAIAFKPNRSVRRG